MSDSKATPEDASQAGSKIDLLKKNGYINNDNFAYPMSPSNTNEQTMHTKVKPFEKFDEDWTQKRPPHIILHDLSEISDE